MRLLLQPGHGVSSRCTEMPWSRQTRGSHGGGGVGGGRSVGATAFNRGCPARTWRSSALPVRQRSLRRLIFVRQEGPRQVRFVRALSEGVTDTPRIERDSSGNRAGLCCWRRRRSGLSARCDPCRPCLSIGHARLLALAVQHSGWHEKWLQRTHALKKQPAPHTRSQQAERLDDGLERLLLGGIKLVAARRAAQHVGQGPRLAAPRRRHRHVLAPDLQSAG